MERRREERFPCNQPARVTCLVSGGEGMDGVVINLSGRGLRVTTKHAIAVGTALRIDVGDMMLLGDVCYCRREGEDYSVGVALAHSILEMSALSKLMTRLTEESHHTHDSVEKLY